MPTRIEDLLDLDTLLTPEDIELRQTVRRFGEQRLRPHVADWFEAGEVPVRELAADLGKLAFASRVHPQKAVLWPVQDSSSEQLDL